MFASSALLGGSVLGVLPVMAAPATSAATMMFQIAPQPLSSALTTFGIQSGWQISAPDSLVAKVSSPGVTGTFVPDAALSRLLTGTGLVYQASGSRSVVIKKTTPSIELDPVRVEGSARAHHLTANMLENAEQVVVKGNRGLVTSSATKSSTPLIDTPQSVSVITRQDMEQRGVLSLNQALRYVAGVTPDLRGGSATRYDLYSLRGFTIPSFLDGLRQQGSPLGYAVPQVDTSRLESIEVLKGPASALYGQSSPGGLVAMASRLPTKAENYGSLEATGGGYDLYRVDGDVGGSLTKNGFIRYRLYGTANGSHSQLTYTKNRRYSITPAISFGGDGPTTLTLLGNFQDDPENNAYGGVPIKGSLYRAAYGYIPRDFYSGDPNYEQFSRRHWATTYIFNHKFNKDWSFSTRGRHDDIRADYESIYSTSYATNTTVNRSAIFANERLSNYAFDSQIKGHFRTGPLSHELMTGFDYQQSHATELTGYGSVSALNILDPVYGIGMTRPTASAAYDIRSHQIGLYAQDQISYGGFHFTGSIRNDWYRSTQVNTIANKTTPQSSEPITWRAAGLYHFSFGLAPYISYATSFQPQSGIVSDDGGKTTRQANPTHGKQLEGGIKYQIPGLPVLFTAAGFHIEQTNVLTAVGNLGYNTESGKVKPTVLNLKRMQTQ